MNTISKKMHPDDVRELLSIHCASSWEPTHEQCSRFMRYLVAGYEGMTFDQIPTVDLKGLALVALDYRRDEPIGEPERDRGCDEMPLGVPRG